MIPFDRKLISYKIIKNSKTPNVNRKIFQRVEPPLHIAASNRILNRKTSTPLFKLI